MHVITYEYSKQFVEDHFELRDIVTHMEHLEAIEDDPSQSREFGVNHKSLLMEIEYFDICSGVLLCDVMHDLFEGVLQYETKLMLIQLIEKHYFNLKNLNNHIESLELPYGTESDKPAFIDRKTLYSQGSRLNQKGRYNNIIIIVCTYYRKVLLHYSCSNVDFGSILTDVYRKKHSN